MIEPSNLLPKEARDLLTAAGVITDERTRRRAVDAAIDKVKSRFPQYFQPVKPIKE